MGPSNQIRTTSCEADGSNEKIKSLCNGKSSCTINPSNGVYGDPCGGTVKYVEITYFCEQAKPQWQSQSQSQSQSQGSWGSQHQSQSQSQSQGSWGSQHQSQSQSQSQRSSGGIQ